MKFFELTKVFIAEAASVVAAAEMAVRVLADVPRTATSSTSTQISTCDKETSKNNVSGPSLRYAM